MKQQELEKTKEYKYGFTTDIESIKAPKGLNEEIIKFISKIKKEPKWMLDWRLKAFKRLKKYDLVQSTRGPHGGYLLTKAPEEIKLSSIIQAVDEKIKTVKCKKNSKKGCNGKSIKCITHNLWDDLETHINNFFEQNTLKDILYKETRYKQNELN